MSSHTCPCCSGKPYDDCCGPFLNRTAIAKTAKQLMRSRYTAYALGGYGTYLLDTWHPAATTGLTAETLSTKALNWQGLKVLHFKQTGDESVVEFEAQYIDGDGDSGLHHETSRFVRLHGKWLYVGST